MKVFNSACLEDDLPLPSRTLRAGAIGKVCPLDRRRVRSRPPRWTLPTIVKWTSDPAPLPPGGGRRRTHESVRVQLVQAFLGSLLIVLMSLWACVAGLDFG